VRQKVLEKYLSKRLLQRPRICSFFLLAVDLRYFLPQTGRFWKRRNITSNNNSRSSYCCRCFKRRMSRPFNSLSSQLFMLKKLVTLDQHVLNSRKDLCPATSSRIEFPSHGYSAPLIIQGSISSTISDSIYTFKIDEKYLLFQYHGQDWYNLDKHINVNLQVLLMKSLVKLRS
jgi:hypothetical protein